MADLLFGPEIRGTDCTRKKVTSQILTKSVVEKKHYSMAKRIQPNFNKR
ncbi:hypothetical protein CASFOL_008128 [Castilleja foliolosa]|uniref:Ribosomal protein S18 n=1 Tax=Castilleja foliolosa TaxID=1961234 RepID=A0ABD3DY31_9LAMI